MSETFRQSEDRPIDLAKTIQELATGCAVVSTLDPTGVPSVAQEVMIYPPMSKRGLIDPQVKLKVINQSNLLTKYLEPVDRESAHEQLEQAMAPTQAEMIDQADQAQAEVAIEPDSDANKRIKELEAALAKEVKKKQPTSRRSDSNLDRFTKNLMSQVGREIGRTITRSITGMFKK